MSSVGSNAPDPRHIALAQASAGGKELRIRQLLDEATWHTQLDKDALRQALQRIAALGNLPLAQLLIERGAEVNVRRDNEISALFRAAENGRPEVVKMLVEHGAHTEARDRFGRTALFPASLRAYIGVELPRRQKKAFLEKRVKTIDEIKKEEAEEAEKKSMRRKDFLEVVKLLLNAKANVDAKDKDERTPLIHLAAERGESVEQDVVELLLLHGADIEAKDATEQRRTALQWAGATGKVEFAKVLLSGKFAAKANLSTENQRGRRALHFAAEQGQDDMVKLFLENGANANAQSNGGWTALHNAAQSNRFGVAKILLEWPGINVNAKLFNGMTALHWAAYNGHASIVQLVISHKDTNIYLKDTFDRTPMLCAAEKNHSTIVYMLSPARNGERLSDVAKDACRQFEATVVDFGMELREGRQRVFKYSVYDLLYGWIGEKGVSGEQASSRRGEKPAPHIDEQIASFEEQKRRLQDLVEEEAHASSKLRRPIVSTAVNNVKHRPAFRWIHLPANNVAWVEALLSKAFVEQGHKDIDDFKAIEKCFTQEHRGPSVHSLFMRTFCSKIHTALHTSHEPNPSHATSKQPENPVDQPLPIILEPKPQAAPKGGRSGPSTPKRVATPNLSDGKENSPTVPTSEEKKKTKAGKRAEKFVENHAKKPKRHLNGPQTSHTGKTSGDHRPKPAKRQPSGKVITELAGGKGKIVLFMPFLHYETDEQRKKMADAIKRFRIEHLSHTSKRIPTDETHDYPKRIGPATRDDLLIEAYLASSPPLHTRRTLDQFYYHALDTSKRDQDQVVYRFCVRRGLEPRIFMVDQLWIFILSNELIITSFPQRWEQPKDDPLNVLDGIIEDTNAKTRPPIKSVYDLAMLITSRCSGMFDRHMLDREDFQFLDMFESSLSHVTNRETALFDRFNRASSEAGKWLKKHRGIRGGKRPAMTSQAGGFQDPGRETDPRFQDDLLDIGTETKLLAEIKDIRDEINMIRTVLDYQKSILPDFATHILEEVGKRSEEGFEASKRKLDQEKLLETHLNDLRRMDKQAGFIYTSLTNLLDLKQKHANAFEARFARDQASLTARQGQTIMVFTIVTIIFLPMSFIAAFFAINIDDFPRAKPGSPGLSLRYVAKYMFGIGLGISLPLIALAFLVDDITILLRRWQSRVHEYLQERKKRNEDEKRGHRGSDGATHPDAELEKPPRLSGFSRHRGDTLDGPPRRSVGVDRGFSPPPRKGTGATQSSRTSDRIRFRGGSGDDVDAMRRIV